MSKEEAESISEMASQQETDLPPRRILLISTVGGTTNSAPMLEICKILHARGHTIDFATLEGGQKAVSRYPFIHQVHFLGRGFTPEEDDEIYNRVSKFTLNTFAGRADIVYCKKFLDSFWTENYAKLKKLVSEVHYDFMFSDYQMDAAKDVMTELKIPLAQMWPQAPLLLAPQPWIPGEPWLQQRCLTSEHASIYDRLFEMTSLIRGLPWLLTTLIWTIRMRRRSGVTRMIQIAKKPDHLVFINSFFGLEIPKDLPPLMNCVGPILADEYPPLDAQCQKFLETHPRTAFIALGTHVRLGFEQFQRLTAGISALVASGRVDGVIWAMQAAFRKQIDMTKPATSTNPKLKGLTYGDLLKNAYSDMLFVDFAPQRAVLSHPNTRIFITHCGASSANEGAYHGVPMLTLAIFSDQIPGALRLRNAGVALSLDKFTFTPEEVQEKMTTILEDKDGSFKRNSLRLSRIARLASKGKELAADLIEQHMYDHELRFDPNNGKELGPMHLQTADSRMGFFRANNWDLKLLGLAVIGGFAGLLAGLLVGLL